MEEHREEVLQAIIEELRSENRHETSAELVKRASKTVAGMAHVISYGFIKRISHSVGQRELTQTYRRVREEEDSAAVALVNTSIKLDHTTAFPMHDITELRASANRRVSYVSSDDTKAFSSRRELSSAKSCQPIGGAS